MIREFEGASRETIMAAIDAGNRAFWEERERPVREAALRVPLRWVKWGVDLRCAAARLRLFPWYFRLGIHLTPEERDRGVIDIPREDDE